MLHITLSKVFSQINHKEIGILKNRQSVQTPSGVSVLGDNSGQKKPLIPTIPAASVSLLSIPSCPGKLSQRYKSKRIGGFSHPELQPVHC